jgi:hypothetical protein
MIQPFQIKRRGRNARKLLIALGGVALLVGLLWGASELKRLAEPESQFVQRMPSDMLFIENKIWNVELEFEKEQYEAMEPKKAETMSAAPGDPASKASDSKPQPEQGPKPGGRTWHVRHARHARNDARHARDAHAHGARLWHRKYFGGCHLSSGRFES